MLKKYNTISESVEREHIKYLKTIDKKYGEKLRLISDIIEKSGIQISDINNLHKKSALLKKQIFINNIALERIPNNFSDLKEYLLKCNSNRSFIKNIDSIVLDNIDFISQESLDSTDEIFKELFDNFSGENCKIKEMRGKIERMGKYPFFTKELYNLEGTEQEILYRDIYILCINYKISNYRWRFKLHEIYSEKGKEEDFPIYNGDRFSRSNIKNKEKLLKLFKGYNTNEEYGNINLMLFLIRDKLGEEIFKKLCTYAKGIREKTVSSAVKKILKDPKKRTNEISNKLILGDQIGIACYFESIDELRQIAQQFKELKDKGEISKFNDRGVLSVTHNNTDTMEDIDPFVNIGLEIEGYPLIEISLRTKENNTVKKIKEEYNENKDIKILFTKLIKKVDSLNHEIYKLSQNIKILRILFVDNGILDLKTNKNKSVQKYIDQNMKIIINILIKKLNSIDITSINMKDPKIEKILRAVILEILEERIGTIITEIAKDTINKGEYTGKVKKEKDKEKINKDIQRIKEYLDSIEDPEELEKTKENLRLCGINKIRKDHGDDRKKRLNIEKKIQTSYERLIKIIVEQNIFYREIATKKKNIEKQINSN